MALKITFTDAQGKVTKEYTAVALKMGIVDKLMEIGEKQALNEIGKPSIKDQKEILFEMRALLVEAFGDQFTYDELNKGASIREVMNCFSSLNDFVMEAAVKN